MGWGRHAWQAFVTRTGWTAPTRTEVATVGKAALAASLAWLLAVAVTDIPDPVLAPLAALICVRVSANASVRTALQRSAAVVLGVLVALGVGDAVGLNALTVGLLTAASLAVALLLLRLPRQAANQMPVTVLVVLAALSANHASYGWERAFNTVIGAGVGAAVSLALPASRVKDARQTIQRLGTTLGDVLRTVSAGLREPWTTKQTTEWRRKARAARDRLVTDAKDAVGNGREAAQWNVRDRRHVAELGGYEDFLPRLESTAIGVSSIARGLDDDAHDVAGGELPPIIAMSAVLGALGDLVGTVTGRVLGQGTEAEAERAFEQVRLKREQCARAASRRAQGALAADEEPAPTDNPTLQWMSYAALLVQVDRIVEDLRAPLPP